MAALSAKVLETVLTGRNLLSPVLAKAGADVAAFNNTVAASQGRASVAATQGATVQSAAAQKITASNVKASTSAQASAAAQTRAHTQAAQSATVASRAQMAANDALIRSNGLLGTSLTPLTAGLGAVALGLGYAGFRGMAFGAAMSQVQAASQATAGDLERLRDAAIDQGAKTQYSAEEAAQGITEMAKAGVSTADVLGGGLAGALNLAAAGQMEVAAAAEVGATALSVFRLEGSQMGHVADLLAAGAGKAQGSVNDLSMALNQSALVANQTGLSIEDTAGALAMFASNGLVGSDAGTSFKTMLQALTPNSKEAARAMDAMGISAYDAQGNFVGLEAFAGQLQAALGGLTEEQRNTTLETIFGSDAVRAASVLYREGASGVAEWTAKVDDAGFAQRQATQLTDNLRGDLERLGGAFDSVMTTIGSGTQGALREVVQMLTGLVEVGGDVIGFWNSLPGPVQAAVAAYAGFLAFRGPLTAMLTALQVKTVLGASSLIEFAFSADRAKGAVGGLVRAALPLAAVVAAGYAVKNVMDFTNASENARESVEDLTESLEGMSNAQKVSALNDEIEKFRDQIHGIENQGFFNKTIWENPFNPDSFKVTEARENIEELRRQIALLEDDSPGALAGALNAIQDFASGFTGAVDTTKQGVEEAIEAHEQWLESLQGVASGFVDPLAAYQGLLTEKQEAERAAAEATAASTDDASDSWEDYVDDVDVSLTELANRLQQQIDNQLNWRNNIAQIAQWAGTDVAQHLANMGQEGVEIVAKMADGSSAEAQRMADLIRQDIALGGMEWSAELDKQMQFMAAMGRLGAGATVRSIAEELGLGLGTVADLAAKYGIALANGINPVLQALGASQVQTGDFRARAGLVVRQADGSVLNGGGESHVAQIAPAGAWRVWAEPETGGEAYIPLAPAKRDRSLDIWRETGKRLSAPEAQYFAAGGFASPADVPRPYSTAPTQPPISTAGDATMQKGFDEVRAWLAANAEATQGAFGGAAGAGSVGGGWQSLWNLVKGQIPQARINSAYRAGDPGYHGRGKAVDLGYGTGPGGAGSAGLASIKRLLHDQVGASLAELIYSGVGNDRNNLKNGAPLNYGAATDAEHRNHVHAAVRDQGGPVYPGLNLIWNGTGRDEWVLPPSGMPGYGAGATGGGAGLGGPVQVLVNARVFIGDRDITDIARIEASAVFANAMDRQNREDRRYQ